jgi:hypothetical protein
MFLASSDSDEGSDSSGAGAEGLTIWIASLNGFG